MPHYVQFGEFRVRSDQIVSAQETSDIEGNPCVMLYYAKGACILLYDEAADNAIAWFADHTNRSVDMPQNIYTNKGTITKPQQDKSRDEREQALKETTLDNIGIPDDLDKVDIRQLQDRNHYRVNVYRRISDRSKMTDSYYVIMTHDGVVASPPMDRKYFDEELAAMSQAS